MIDLHTHTTCSDGTLSPAELLAAARAAGLTAVSITDHDTLAAYDDPATREPGLTLVPGVELSLTWPRGNLHLLGYGIDPHHADLRGALVDLLVSRAERNETMIARLRSAGVEITFADVAAIAGNDYIGRPHMAVALVNAGAVGSVAEAFARYLGDDQPYYVPRRDLEPALAIALVHAAGGAAVLAHPYQTRLVGEDLVGAIGRWVDLGLDGLEVYYPRHTRRQVRQYRALAERFGLCLTAGSDFHGATKPDIRLGQTPGRRASDKALLADLAARAGGQG
jgi:predicted metal-dependent phosphoesterase TrpH